MLMEVVVDEFFDFRDCEVVGCDWEVVGGDWEIFQVVCVGFYCGEQCQLCLQDLLVG